MQGSVDMSEISDKAICYGDFFLFLSVVEQYVSKCRKTAIADAARCQVIEAQYYSTTPECYEFCKKVFEACKKPPGFDEPSWTTRLWTRRTASNLSITEVFLEAKMFLDTLQAGKSWEQSWVAQKQLVHGCTKGLFTHQEEMLFMRS